MVRITVLLGDILCNWLENCLREGSKWYEPPAEPTEAWLREARSAGGETLAAIS